MNAIEDEVIDDYKLLVAGFERDKIIKFSLGFVDNSFKDLMLSVVIHSIENIEIFDDNRLKSLQVIINKLM